VSATLGVVSCPYSVSFGELRTGDAGTWSISISSDEVGSPLAPATYEDTQRYPFETFPYPGLDVSGDGRGCNMSKGTFAVEEITWQGSTLASLTLTFEQHCEDATPAARGCFHYQQQ
jgi:hypothetical protein